VSMAEDSVKKGDKDGEVREEDPENGALVGLASPREVDEVLYPDVLVPIRTRIRLPWGLVGVY
jgi:hypothetical protein